MKVTAFLHAKLDVADLERSEAFYRGLLGLREVVRYPIPAGTILQLSPDGQPPGVELWHDRDTPPDPPTRLHVAFAVDDTRAWVERLRAAGVHVEQEPFTVGHEVIAFVRDPDGYLIELNQADGPPPDRDPGTDGQDVSAHTTR
jgi:lactoylglutathione lyase